ncbi:hypothetical protein EC988_005770 [Linderina pennispora]|nr:hypothetical protein EC988_005770 [Linderina pennispora]
MSGGFGDAVVPTISSAQGMSISGVGSRRSADLSDLLLFWDRSVPLATSSAAIDSLSLINAGAPLDAASDLDFVRHLSPVNSVRDTGRLTRSSLWGSSAGDPSLSTTTAEASALSILKDTDLAYPTPARQRSSGGSSIGRMSDLARRDFQRPSMVSAGHARPLDRILTSSFENLDQRSVLGNATSPHFRFQSLDLRAGSGWPDFERADGRESGRSSTVNDRPSPVFPEAVAGQQSADPFSLRSTTPAAEQTQSLIFGGSLVNPRRPLVEPIGAPVRKREREQKQSSDQGVDALANPLRIPIDREMSHPTSFGGSLYHSRSIWDADDKDDRRK